MKNATFRQLRIFSEAARHESFAQAARALHLTPPAVSMQIKELEAHVGLPLFERDGRKVRLSTAGEYVLVYARRILAGLKDAEDAVARLRKLQAGRLSIGMVSTAKYFLPRLLARFRQAHPGVEIRLAVGNREQLVKMLQAGEVDIAVMGRAPKELATRAESFAAHPHVFIAPPDHPLAQQAQAQPQALPPQQLQHWPFISREAGSGTRAALERYLQEHQLTLEVSMEMSSNETIKQAVMAGMGISFVSLHTIGLEVSHGLLSVLRVQGSPVVRAWNSVHPLSKLLSPAAQAFRDFVLSQGASHLAEQFGALDMSAQPPAQDTPA
ncbi:MAG: DUF1922 domain-containing protein [Pseudomonadota bacterium]|nr:DUF1922 domain-containing protein [Pseudomonadota bacterium]